MRGLKDRVAVVTGAAGGIGRAICRRFIEEDVIVLALDVNAEPCPERSAYGPCHVVAATSRLDRSGHAGEDRVLLGTGPATSDVTGKAEGAPLAKR